MKMSRENGDFRVFPYSTFFHPPAPVIPAVISSLEDPTRSLTREAKVDTGADITTVPMAIIDALNVVPAREVLAIGFNSTEARRLTYYVNLHLAGYDFSPIEVMSSAGNDFLIGRDVLNQWLVVLDGEKRTLKIEGENAA
jgi:predicted aspartyl protease